MRDQFGCGLFFFLLIITSIFLPFVSSTPSEKAPQKRVFQRGKVGQYLPLEPVNEIKISKIDQSELTSKNFYYNFVAKSQPVIIQNLINQWEIKEKWKNQTYLMEKLGHIKINVEFLQEREISFSPLFSNENQTEESNHKVPFSDLFLNFSQPQHHHRHRHYFAQTSIKEKAPELAGDLGEISFVKFLKPSVIDHILLSLASGEQVFPLHLETIERFIIQLEGKKNFTLFHPSQSNFLYPIEKDLNLPILSQVNISNPNLSSFPLFKNASGVDITLNEGEVLFIPSFWWYQTHSMEKKCCSFIVL
eukprot:TRINITY_DN11289_c0_g1_i1.p1 TRINITY_DN11289_c0_g1~~TRINITY_DN11289_c0_g1_i1.p1  ORF type:complete len:328 (+),score=99.03 TRINITY_DN11289_c0_g1_i1:70-984(+)